jgi:hypothetical protein
MFATFAGIIAVAIVAATGEAALAYHALGPILAAALGVAIGPVLLRGASSGRMSRTVAWVATVTGCVICCVATIGLDPRRMDLLSLSWYPCGVLAGAAMVWMAGHRFPPLVAACCLVVQTTSWAGFFGMLRLGIAAELVVVVAALTMHRAVRRITEAAAAAAVEDRELTIWQADQDAFQLERQMRLHLAGRNATPMLERIISLGGDLEPESRAECRVLEQTLRDEIRGRRLLNDAVRAAVLAHRRRGAFVQVLDDGGLDDLPARAVNPLLDQLASSLEPLTSSRIVIRSGRPNATTAITVVATTPDEMAVALGIEEDEDQVDLWLALPRPVPVPALP